MLFLPALLYSFAYRGGFTGIANATPRIANNECGIRTGKRYKCQTCTFRPFNRKAGWCRDSHQHRATGMYGFLDEFITASCR